MLQCSPASWTPCPTKAELRRKLAAGVRQVEFLANTGGYVFADEAPGGKFVVVGPSATQRDWYATVTVCDGKARVS